MSLVEYKGEYFPAVTEDSSRIVWIGGIAAIVFCAMLIVWASVAQVARAAIAQGVVVVEGSRRAVQHRDGGPVAEVFVHDGQLVKAGEVLVRLDLSEVRAQVEVLTQQRLQTIAQLARFRAEAADATSVTYPPDLDKHRDDPVIAQLIDQQDALFKARLTAFAGNRTLLEQQIAGYQEQIRGLQGQIKKTNDQIDLINEELVGLKSLLAKGLTPKSRVLQLQRNAAELGGNLEGLSAQIAGAENSIHSAQLQIEQLKKDRRQEIATGLQELDARLAETEPNLASAQNQLSRVDLVAPVSGYVLNLMVHGPGATITPGQVVLEIVPENQPLVISAQINPDDIDKVRPGQDAEVAFAAYAQRFQEAVKGTLTAVSADKIQDPITQLYYYTGVVKLDPESLAAAKISMVPGMNVTSTIKTGSRTVMEYFLDPVYHVYDYAMKED